jgi:WD40 repeat protein
VALSGDGLWALSSGEDQTVRFWDLETGQCRAVLSGHTSGVLSVALSADGRWGLSGGNDRTLRWWDLETGQCRAALGGHSGRILSVALSADGRRALSGSDDHTVRCSDLETGRCRAVFPCDWEVQAVALTPRAPWLACVGGRASAVWFFEIKQPGSC